MKNYSVLVGNIGNVYSGKSLKEARKHFHEYKSQSKENYGRASHEDVFLLCDGEPIKEFIPTKKTPTIKEIYPLIVALKKSIGEDYRASEEDDKPSMSVTVGCNDQGEWNYQTGDNSFTGGAYGFPHWAVVSIYRNSNSLEIARDVVSQLKEAQSY